MLHPLMFRPMNQAPQVHFGTINHSTKASPNPASASPPKNSPDNERPLATLPELAGTDAEAVEDPCGAPDAEPAVALAAAAADADEDAEAIDELLLDDTTVTVVITGTVLCPLVLEMVVTRVEPVRSLFDAVVLEL